MNKMEQKEKIQIINVYSGDRDVNIYPNPNHYKINLLDTIGSTFKNIISIRVLYAVLPDVNNITREPVVILNINELSSTGMTGTNNNLQNGSIVLQLDKPVSDGYFLNTTDLCKNIYSVFEHPLAELSRLEITMKKIDGTKINFGNDTNPVNPLLQHLVCLEITYKDYNNVIMKNII